MPRFGCGFGGPTTTGCSWKVSGGGAVISGGGGTGGSCAPAPWLPPRHSPAMAPAESAKMRGVHTGATAAKALMEKADVPLTPGYHGPEQDPAFLAR